MEFALLHSPFLAPSSSVPLARALEARGEFARVVSASEAFDDHQTSYGGVADVIARQLREPCVLVAHSGAGALVPSIVTAAQDRVRHAIFVDATLPHDGLSWFDTVPEPLAKRMRELARDGRAPRWSDWFSDRTLGRLLPNETERRRLVSGMPRIPLAFLQRPAPTVADWLASECCRYLQLSDGYAVEAERSRALGWRGHRLPGDHLWTMTHPQEVAAALIDLVSA